MTYFTSGSLRCLGLLDLDLDKEREDDFSLPLDITL